jgi:hypothetical protein
MFRHCVIEKKVYYFSQTKLNYKLKRTIFYRRKRRKKRARDRTKLVRTYIYIL